MEIIQKVTKYNKGNDVFICKLSNDDKIKLSSLIVYLNFTITAIFIDSETNCQLTSMFTET